MPRVSPGFNLRRLTAGVILINSRTVKQAFIDEALVALACFCGSEISAVALLSTITAGNPMGSSLANSNAYSVEGNVGFLVVCSAIPKPVFNWCSPSTNQLQICYLVSLEETERRGWNPLESSPLSSAHALSFCAKV